jgi:hypothetical protein
MTKVEIQNISFDGDGNMEVAYYIPAADVKAPGLAKMTTLVIPKGYEYDDEMDAVYEAATHLVLDILEDFDKLPAMIETPVGE